MNPTIQAAYALKVAIGRFAACLLLKDERGSRYRTIEKTVDGKVINIDTQQLDGHWQILAEASPNQLRSIKGRLDVAATGWGADNLPFRSPEAFARYIALGQGEHGPNVPI